MFLCHSVHSELLDLYRKSVFVILNECAHRVKGSNVQLTKQSLRNFLGFTRCNCLELFLVSFDRKSLAFESSKESDVKLRLSLDISFVVSSEFYPFDEK